MEIPTVDIIEDIIEDITDDRNFSNMTPNRVR